MIKLTDLDRFRAILQAPQNAHLNLPTNIAEWVDHQGSLTQKLLQVCGDLKVKISREEWVEISENPTACWLREVVLQCGNQNWVFAQTWIPKPTVENVAQSVLTLGDQPIGLWLFAQNPQRVDFQYGQDAETGLFYRHSHYLLHNYPLEIRELFLPDFTFKKD
ncbi:hypothetical protein B0187_06460 [Haemophilus paracuniculus]|uniref:Chorismate lyase n=2 Tax=Haemophilus paracuniculus TaxID=734 RepID=A0A1T0ARQ6_9PAST|nr:hypothetical protein B0187_06460 [Haemophilus paracuniculus]